MQPKWCKFIFDNQLSLLYKWWLQAQFILCVTLFVEHWIYMVDRRYAPSIHCFLLDNYVGQFKSHKPWYFVGFYSNLTSGCVTTWFFFGIGDGKGAHDGTKAVMKQFLRQEQLNAHGQS